MSHILTVSAEEAGQKLLSFLQRCLLNEDAELYRWIRSGQVRINSGRAKPTSRIIEGDAIRVPPFAQTRNSRISIQEKNPYPPLQYIQNGEQKIIPKIYENDHILIINKPAHLASQGGTKQDINLVDILKKAYQKERFLPAPVHRLDKETTGLLCIGKSYSALRFLSDFFQEEVLECGDLLKKNLPHKEYLVWVHATDFQKNMPLGGTPFYMEHYVYQDDDLGGVQAMTLDHLQQNLARQNTLSKVKYALSVVTCLATHQDYILLKIGLFTGRKHQIRVQCATSGFPLVGDAKYGVHQKKKETLKLHAYRLELPVNKELYTENIFHVQPPWEGRFKVDLR